MPRNTHKGRGTVGGGEFSAELRALGDKPVRERVLTSSALVEMALGRVKATDAARPSRSFAGRVIRIWGRPTAPEEADDFWFQHVDLEKDEDRKRVLGTFKRSFGPVIGWAVLEISKPEDLGGDTIREINLFDPIRLEAGKLATEALLGACGGSEELFQAFSEPIPRGVTQSPYRSWSNQLQFRLAEYPDVGSSIDVIADAANVTVYNRGY